MGQTTCYAMVRGSAIRVTGLNRRGSLTDPIQYGVSTAVARVQINETVESGSSEMLGSEQEDNDNRLRFSRPDEMINYTADIDFLRCDPGILNLITAVPLVHEATGGPGFGRSIFGEAPFGSGEADFSGFGEESFGEMDFGDGTEDDLGTVVGFDFETRTVPVSFALEVWSKLAGVACVDGRQYGYTVFPYLRGGRLSGFEFKNGLVSFNIRNAKCRREPRWGVGPYDLEGPWERLLQPVSRNTLYRQMLTSAKPPIDAFGIQETEDVLSGGTSSVTSEDVVSGGTSAYTSPWIIQGGSSL